MDERIEAAARYVGAEPDQVMSGRVYADRVAIVIDWGIKGGKKYLVPRSELEQSPPPDITAAAARLARRHGIDAITITGTGRNGRITVTDVRETIHATESDSTI